MRTRTRTTSLLVALLVVLAGCSGGAPGLGSSNAGDGGGADGGNDLGAGEPGAGSEAQRGDTADGSDDLAAIQQRAVIYTGTVSLTVDDFEESSDAVRALAEGKGGFVSNTDRETNRVGNESFTRGSVTIRVPSDEFVDTFEELKGMGELETATYDTEDVTDQLVDLEARLGNLRAQRDRLRDLYEEANETEDVLAISDRLSEVQGEIERLEAKKQSLENRVAFSTITVRMSEERPEPERTLPMQYHETPLGKAFLASVDGVVVVVQSLAVSVAYAVPYVVAFGVPLGAAAWVARRRL